MIRQTPDSSHLKEQEFLCTFTELQYVTFMFQLTFSVHREELFYIINYFKDIKMLKTQRASI